MYESVRRPRRRDENVEIAQSQVLGAALLSSSSSVYFEKMLKKPGGAGGVPEAGLWVRNIQLGSFANGI